MTNPYDDPLSDERLAPLNPIGWKPSGPPTESPTDQPSSHVGSEDVESVPDLPSKVPGKTGPVGKYPWDVWLNGEWHTVQRKFDFTISIPDLQARLHNKGRRMDLWCYSKRKAEDLLEFKFFKTRAERDIAALEEKMN